MISKAKGRELIKFFEELTESGEFSGEQAKGLLRYLRNRAKPIKPRSAKNKGKRLQNMGCEYISKYTGFEWDNSNDDAPIRSREMGQQGVDIILSPEVREVFPFSVECKNVEAFSMVPTIKQAELNKKEGDYWMIIHNNSRLDKPVVIVDIDTFFEFCYRDKE